MRNKILLSLACTVLLAQSHAFAWTKQESGQAARLPNLVEACSKYCPDAKSNEEAAACVKEKNKHPGELASQQLASTCLNAYNDYKKHPKQSAGTFSKDQGSEQAPEAP